MEKRRRTKLISCRGFQNGTCRRGAKCKFSHDTNRKNDNDDDDRDVGAPIPRGGGGQDGSGGELGAEAMDLA